MASKYQEPPKTKETSILDDVVNAAEEGGAQLIASVEDACEALVDSVQAKIEGMVQNAIDTATGIYNTAASIVEGVADQVEGAIDSVVETTETFANDLNEAWDDIMSDEAATQNSKLQASTLDSTTDKIDSLTEKEIKTLTENPDSLMSMSNNLTTQGLDNMKNTAIGGIIG